MQKLSLRALWNSLKNSKLWLGVRGFTLSRKKPTLLLVGYSMLSKQPIVSAVTRNNNYHHIWNKLAGGYEAKYGKKQIINVDCLDELVLDNLRVDGVLVGIDYQDLLQIHEEALNQFIIDIVNKIKQAGSAKEIKIPYYIFISHCPSISNTSSDIGVLNQSWYLPTHHALFVKALEQLNQAISAGSINSSQFASYCDINFLLNKLVTFIDKQDDQSHSAIRLVPAGIAIDSAGANEQALNFIDKIVPMQQQQIQPTQASIIIRYAGIILSVFVMLYSSFLFVRNYQLNKHFNHDALLSSKSVNVINAISSPADLVATQYNSYQQQVDKISTHFIATALGWLPGKALLAIEESHLLRLFQRLVATQISNQVHAKLTTQAHDWPMLTHEQQIKVLNDYSDLLDIYIFLNAGHDRLNKSAKYQLVSFISQGQLNNVSAFYDFLDFYSKSNTAEKQPQYIDYQLVGKVKAQLSMFTMVNHLTSFLLKHWEQEFVSIDSLMPLPQNLLSNSGMIQVDFAKEIPDLNQYSHTLMELFLRDVAIDLTESDRLSLEQTIIPLYRKEQEKAWHYLLQSLSLRASVENNPRQLSLLLNEGGTVRQLLKYLSDISPPIEVDINSYLQSLEAINLQEKNSNIRVIIDDLVSAQRLLTSLCSQIEDDSTRKSVQHLLKLPFDVVVNLLEKQLEDRWATQIYTDYQNNIATQLLALTSNADISVENIVHFFNRQSALSSFINDVRVSSANEVIHFNTDFWQAADDFHAISQLLFQNGSTLGFDFSIRTKPSPIFSKIKFTFGDLIYEYANGPEEWAPLHWQVNDDVALSIYDPQNQLSTHLEGLGGWGFFQLLHQAEVSIIDKNRVFVSWPIKRGGQPVDSLQLQLKIPGGADAFTQLLGQKFILPRVILD